MAFPKIASHFETQLVNKIDSSSTTMVLASVATPAGNLGAGTYGFVIDEESGSKREYCIGTLSGSTVTFTKRDVSPLDATTEDSSADTARQSHRKGASVKITDFPLLLLIQRVLEGTDQLDPATPLQYSGTASISNANQLATKAYVDSVVNGGTLTIQDQVMLGDAGETIAEGEYVYLNTADGEWYKVDADNSAHLDGTRKGIAQGAGTDGNAISGGILVEGLDTTISYTAGQLYYASNTAGAIATSAGTIPWVIGVGDANNKLLIFPTPYQLTKAQKDALAGAGATPSSSNKFLTVGDVDDVTLLPPIQIVTFTASGTWTKDAGLKYIVVEVQGAGGNGGENGGGNGGGGAGAYSKKLILASDLGATETVTVGAGGVGSGNTSFGAHALAGNGANGSGSSGGAGGTASGGDINITGQAGGMGSIDSSGSNNPTIGGFGGNSFYGRGGTPVRNSDNNNATSGNAGSGYGGGGGGGADAMDGSPDASGGAGTAGIVIVTEYYV